MKFYVFKHAIATKETGRVFPQIQNMSENYNFDTPYSVDALSRYVNKLPNFAPNLDCFILNSKANATDLLSSSTIANNGFLISEKIKNILSNYKLPDHKYFSATIQQGTTTLYYYWIHIGSDFNDFIDYKKSSFNIIENYSEIKQKVKIISKEDYISKKSEVNNKDINDSIQASQIVMTNDFDRNINLFNFLNLDDNFYISEELMKDLVKNKVTGIDMSIASNISL